MPHQHQPTNDLESLRLSELQQRFFAVVGQETRCPNRTFLIRRIEQALLQRGEQPAAEQVNEHGIDGQIVRQPAEQSHASPNIDSTATGEDLVRAEPPHGSEENTGHDHETAEEANDAPAQPSPELRKMSNKNTPGTGRVRNQQRGRFKTMTVEELQSMYLQKVCRPTGSTDKDYLIWKIREAEKGRIPIGPREARSANQRGAANVRVLPLRIDVRAVDHMDAAWKTQGMKSRMEFFRRAIGHYLRHIGLDDAAALFGPERED